MQIAGNSLEENLINLSITLILFLSENGFFLDESKEFNLLLQSKFLLFQLEKIQNKIELINISTTNSGKRKFKEKII